MRLMLAREPRRDCAAPGCGRAMSDAAMSAVATREDGIDNRTTRRKRRQRDRELSARENLRLSALAERNDVVLVGPSGFHARRPLHHARHCEAYHVRRSRCNELVDQISG